MGSRGVGVPGGGIAARRRRRPEQLAPIHPYAGARRGRRHRRPGVRFLPALSRGRRDDGGARVERLPFQRRLEPDPPGGARSGQPQGTRLLRAPDRRAARVRHPARRHALSLGPPRRSRRPGRMAQPGHRRMVRRLCPRPLPRVRRPRRALDDLERAVGRDRRRLPPRQARPRTSQRLRGADRRAPSPARPRRRRAGLPRRGQARDRTGGEPRAEISGVLRGDWTSPRRAARTPT